MRLTLVSLLLTAAPAAACSVPVFRYALERWAPSRYEALVFHRGPLSDAQRERLAALERRRLNAAVRAIDLGRPLKPGHRVILGKNAPPYVSVRYPDADETTPAAWSGPLDALPAALGDSPARRELVRLLGKGTAVVWILLDGDAATEAMLRRELARLQKALVLPAVEPAELKSRLPLTLSFAVLKVARRGPEADLARELLDGDEELRQATGPVIFPVIGRGRMLFGLHGKGLTAQEISQAAAFATAACSCQVKELNPGIDLLLAADWPALLDVAEPAVEDVPTLPAPPIPPGVPDVPGPAKPAPAGGWAVPAALAGAMALGLGWWAVRNGREDGAGPRGPAGVR